MTRRILPLLLLLPFTGCVTALTKAVNEGRVEDFIGQVTPANVNKCVLCESAFRTTVLGCAARNGRVNAVKALLKKGANVNAKCPDSQMIAAVRGGSPKIVELLLAAGADTGERPHSMVYDSPLSIAVQYGYFNIAHLLLEAGADVESEYEAINATWKGGFRPILWAVRGGHLDAVRVLLKYCADDRHKSTGFGSKNAHDWARKNKREDLAKLLQDYEGKEACLKQRKTRKTEAELRNIAEIENAGINLAKQGNSRGAIKKFSQALDAAGDSGKGKARARIIKRIFKIAAKSKPPVPKEAKRFSIRAQAIVKGGNSKTDFEDAVLEIKKALRAAPWWPEAYFNLALMQEKAGQPASAMRNLKLYLAAKPGARDAAAVERKIIELEVQIERSGR